VFFAGFERLAIESALRRIPSSVCFATRGLMKWRATQAVATAIKLTLRLRRRRFLRRA
jgi:hypothetical protein